MAKPKEIHFDLGIMLEDAFTAGGMATASIWKRSAAAREKMSAKESGIQAKRDGEKFRQECIEYVKETLQNFLDATETNKEGVIH